MLPQIRHRVKCDDIHPQPAPVGAAFQIGARDDIERHQPPRLTVAQAFVLENGFHFTLAEDEGFGHGSGRWEVGETGSGGEEETGNYDFSRLSFSRMKRSTHWVSWST